MKKKGSLLLTVALAALLAGGCGTPLYELTDDEENIIVQSAAQIVAKYNVEQGDGMTAAVPETEAGTETETEIGTEAEPETETETQPSASPSETDTPSAEMQTGETAGTLSVAAAIGHDSDLTVACKSRAIQDTYTEGSYFAINPDDGKKLAVFTFTITNSGEETVELETVSLDNPFSVTLDGTGTIEETVSLGVQSLSSYSGEIEAGKSVTAVLLFQVPDSYGGDLSEAQLSVQMDGANYSVEL